MATQQQTTDNANYGEKSFWTHLLEIGNLQFIQVVCYSIIWLLGTIGALLVAYVILISKQSKKSSTITNIHLLNLALANMVYLQGIPFMITFLIKQEWPFSLLLCKLYYVLSMINQYTGIFILAFLSLDRFLAVCKPSIVDLRRMFASKLSIAILWILSILFLSPILILVGLETYDTNTLRGYYQQQQASNSNSTDTHQQQFDTTAITSTKTSSLTTAMTPIVVIVTGAQPRYVKPRSYELTTTTLLTDYYYYSMNSSGADPNQTQTHSDDNKLVSVCTVLWPVSTIVRVDLAFTIFSIIFSFLIPIVTISYFYIRIIMRLKSSSFRFMKTESKHQQQKRKKVNLMVLFIIGISVVTYTPYWLFQMFILFYSYIIKSPTVTPAGIGQLATFSQLLLYLNAALNPYLYAFFSEIFRASFREAFFCFRVAKLNNTNMITTTNMVETNANEMQSRYRRSFLAQAKQTELAAKTIKIENDECGDDENNDETANLKPFESDTKK